MSGASREMERASKRNRIREEYSASVEKSVGCHTKVDDSKPAFSNWQGRDDERRTESNAPSARRYETSVRPWASWESRSFINLNISSKSAAIISPAIQTARGIRIQNVGGDVWLWTQDVVVNNDGVSEFADSGCLAGACGSELTNRAAMRIVTSVHCDTSFL